MAEDRYGGRVDAADTLESRAAEIRPPSPRLIHEHVLIDADIEDGILGHGMGK